MNATAASEKIKDDNSILWAGCGINKKAFMAELAQAYEAKTGIKIKLQGGGAATYTVKDLTSDIDDRFWPKEERVGHSMLILKLPNNTSKTNHL